MKSVSSLTSTAVRAAAKPHAPPLDNDMPSLDPTDTLKGAIYKYVEERQLTTVENLPFVHQDLARLIGVRPGQVEEAFRGRPLSLAINYAASRPDDFNAFFAEFSQGASFRYALKFGASAGLFTGAHLSGALTYSQPEEATLMIFMIGLTSLASAGFMTASLLRKPHYDERQDEFRAKVRAFVEQFRGGMPVVDKTLLPEPQLAA